MDNLMGMKEFYNVTLKANFPIEIGNQKIEEGEVIARFDKIQIATFNEIKNRTAAKGGYQNQTRITWEDSKEVDLYFTQGIFSKTQFALMSNSNLIETKNKEAIEITNTEEVESDENGIFNLKVPYGKKIFIYKKSNGEKILNFEKIDNNKLKITEPYTDLLIDYSYEYMDGATTVQIGNRLIQGFVSLEGRVRTKDDITGATRTGIIKIPKLKLMSDLSMRLGSGASPLVANFKAIGYPTGAKGDSKIIDIIFLNDDIDSDM